CRCIETRRSRPLWPTDRSLSSLIRPKTACTRTRRCCSRCCVERTRTEVTQNTAREAVSRASYEKDERRKRRNEMVECPECGAESAAGCVEAGVITVCTDCGCELEVLTTDPVTVGQAPEEGEDWGE